MKKRKGFSLIELLLALAIFSVIALSLYSTFAAGIQLNKRSEDIQKVYREVRWALETMVKEFENAATYDFSASYPGQTPFRGNDDTVTFLLPTGEGLKFISYYLHDPDRGEVHTVEIGAAYSRNVPVIVRSHEDPRLTYLVREERSFIDYLQSPDSHNGQIEILCTQVKNEGLKFTYAFLEGKEENQRIVWRAPWTLPYVPSGVHLELTFIDPTLSQKEITWPRDIIIPTGFWGPEVETKTETDLLGY